MREIEIELTGVSPLLMNSPKGMLEPEKNVKNRLKKYDSKVEAERVAYRNEDGKLFVPATAIKGCIINASAYKKAGKYSLRPLLAGGLRIRESEIILNKQKYDIDLRTVVIQRARVVKARPKIVDWKLSFGIIYNENLIGNPDIIKEILEEAGQRVGILDFRPQKSGEFGMFEVTKFEVK